MAYDNTPWDDLHWAAGNRVEATQQIIFGFRAGEPLYEMVVCDENAKAFAELFTEFIACARTTGLKVPAIPRELRAEFSSELNLGLPKGGKSHDAGKDKDKDIDRSMPGGGEAPEDFWVTPRGKQPYALRKEFKALRDRIWTESGHDVQQGRVPNDIAYAWAKKHPEALWEWVRAHPELFGEH